MSGVGTTKHKFIHLLQHVATKRYRGVLIVIIAKERQRKRKEDIRKLFLLLFLLQNHADLQHGIAQQETLHYQESLS